MIEVTPAILIPEDEITERFIRAAGPGGQNVNKVSTASKVRRVEGKVRRGGVKSLRGKVRGED